MSVNKKIPFKRFLPGIAWFFISGILTLIPGKNVPEIGWITISYFDKLVHMALFGGLTLLFCLPYFKSHFSLQKKINYFVWVGVLAFIWGGTIELIQKFLITGRSFEWLDLLADGLGIFAGFIIARKIAVIKARSDLR